MSIWVEGTVEIDTELDAVKDSLADLGEHYVGVVRSMPGMTDVELIEHGDGFVTIRTNEGLMRRTGMVRDIDDDRVTVEFDETYDAGKVVANSHFRDEFSSTETGVRYRTTVSDVEAGGLLGFLYRRFGSKNMGKAFLSSHKAFLETLDDTRS